MIHNIFILCIPISLINFQQEYPPQINYLIRYNELVNIPFLLLMNGDINQPHNINILKVNQLNTLLSKNL